METPKQIDSTTASLLPSPNTSSGLVLYALGSATVTSALSQSKRAALYDSFASFPSHHFLVKTSADDWWSRNYTAGAGNIVMAEWWPQADLLGDDRMKVFITHAGYNSVVESALRGVPMLSVPLFFDQFRNAKAAEWAGYSLTLEKGALADRQQVTLALRELMTNPVYGQRARKLAGMMTDRRKGSEALAEGIAWVLKVRRDDGSERFLRLKGDWGMGLVGFLHLDLIAALTVLVVVLYMA